MHIIRQGCLLFVMLCLLFIATQAEAAYKIGVLAKRGGIIALERWGKHGVYLSESLGTQFVIIPVKFSSIPHMVQGQKIDFLLANPAIFAEMQEQYGLEAVATMINRSSGKGVHQFGGVIFVKQDSPIKNLADIKGKTFGFVKHSSFGGLHAALYLLQQNGIDPRQDYDHYLEFKTHDNVVHAVEKGEADVGTVRTDTLERMAAEGKIKMEDFRVLNQVQDDFPFVHSTELYPEWPMAALAHTDKKIAEEVGKALCRIKADSEEAQKAEIMGWEEKADYTPVRKCLQAINYNMFSKKITAPE